MAELTTPDEAPPILEVDGVNVSYGVIRAVQDAHLALRTGSTTALVGSNGAGKSSLMKAIAGVQRVKSGQVRVRGTDITRLDARRRVLDHGLVLIPEGRSAFVTMTVAENLELGSRVGRARNSGMQLGLDEVLAMFGVLKERFRQPAQVLSGGEQQMLAIARSLLMGPEILLIDEPSMGLAPLLVRKIFATLSTVFTEHHVSVLLVEQDTALALNLSSHAYLIEQGRITHDAPSDELRDDPRLRAAYLGSADALGNAVDAAEAEGATS